MLGRLSLHQMAELEASQRENSERSRRRLTKSGSRKKRGSQCGGRHRPTVSRGTARCPANPESSNNVIVTSLRATEATVETAESRGSVELNPCADVVLVAGRQAISDVISNQRSERKISIGIASVADDVVLDACRIRERLACTSRASWQCVNRSRRRCALSIRRTTQCTGRVRVAAHGAEQRAIITNEVKGFAAACPSA